MINGCRKFIVLAISATVLWLSMIAIGILVFYDGGVSCFLAPKVCKYNAVQVQIAMPIIVTTPVPIARSTLRPTPTQWSTPDTTPTLDATPESVSTAIRQASSGDVSCDANPYKYNDISQYWERHFHVVCYDILGDPFELIFGGYNESDGMTYDQVYNVLSILGIAELTHNQQTQELSRMGFWNSDCGCMLEDFSVLLDRHLREENSDE